MDYETILVSPDNQRVKNDNLKKITRTTKVSRQTRHQQTYLNQIYEQKLRRELDHITDEYEQTFLRSKSHQKLERQRKQALDITIQQIARERNGHVLPTKIERKPIKRLSERR